MSAHGIAPDVRALIERGAVETHFHPIAAIRRKAILGVEALSRGIAEDGTLVPPVTLFEHAAAAGLTLELDRLCRRRAVESFLPLYSANRELILFVNLSPEAFDVDAEGEHSLLALVRGMNLDTHNVCVEVLESAFAEADRLRSTVDEYKRQGFLVALDDLGAGHSNLDRITYVRPDIIKIDRALVADIHNDYYKQEVYKALVQLSEKIGGWTISEGVEEQAEALAMLGMGGDLLQGFYFARPHKPTGTADLSYDRARVEAVAVEFKEHMLDRFRSERAERARRRTTTEEIMRRMGGVRAEESERELEAVLAAHPEVESACVLDMAGVQTSETVWHPRHVDAEKTVIFRPPSRGTDHSFKEYYYLLVETGAEMYETPPYVPLPSGDLCVTITTRFADEGGEPRIMCLHLNVGRG